MITLNTSKILVPFDFSFTAKKAIEHAALLAKATKGELQLFYVTPSSVFNTGFSKAELRRLAEEKISYENKIEETASEIRQQFKVAVKVLVGRGRPVSGIKKFCEKHDIGLVVMGTQGSDSVSSLFKGSISHQVVSNSDIPVLTVRSESQVQGYTNILVPVDLSEHTRQKMVVAIRIAKLFSAKIHLVGFLLKADQDHEFKLKQIIKQVEKRLKEEGINYHNELISTEDPARATIAKAEHINADLIITMTDQDSGASLLGSRSYDRELIDDSKIPVLSIPPETHFENMDSSSFGSM